MRRDRDEGESKCEKCGMLLANLGLFYCPHCKYRIADQIEIGNRIRNAAAVLILAVVALAAPSTASATPVCQDKVGPQQGFWRWKLVDGRKCWYIARRILDRSNLHWVAPDEVDDDGVSGRVIERKYYTPEELRR